MSENQFERKVAKGKRKIAPYQYKLDKSLVGY